MPLTERQAYDAMFLFLLEFWERGNRSSADIAELLEWMRHAPDDVSSDPAMDDDWDKAVERILAGHDPHRAVDL